MFRKLLITSALFVGIFINTTQAGTIHQHNGGNNRNNRNNNINDHIDSTKLGAHKGPGGWYNQDCNITPFIPGFYYRCPYPGPDQHYY
jgi:hypothetical protein